MIKGVYGLVLAGGKSQRMGRDKGLINWHGKPQRYYQADIMSNLVEKAFISCRADQEKAINDDGYMPLVDCASAKSQFGAILSALKTHPNVAWLVLACDIVHADADALKRLIDNRDKNKYATAYQDKDGLPEPLIAIWEPKSLNLLEKELASGITCPRKALIKNIDKIKLIKPEKPEHIKNVNTPDSAKKAEEFIKSR